jgi:dipeptidyl-peptidase-4
MRLRALSLVVLPVATSILGCGAAPCPPPVTAAAPASTRSESLETATETAAELTVTPPESGILAQISATQNFRLGRPERIRVSPNGSTVYFLRSGAREPARDLYALDVVSGAERRVVTAEALLGGSSEELSDAERARRERQRLIARGIGDYALSPDGTTLLVPLSGKLFLVDAQTGRARTVGDAAAREAPIDARFSPDGRQLACVRDGDLYVIDVASGRERRLTRRPSRAVSYGEAEFVAQEEMDRMEGYWWSPDGATLAVEEADTTPEETFHIADPAHPERAPAAFPYPRAGRANALVRLGLLPAQGGRFTWVEWDRARYPYLAKVVWPAHGPLTVLVQNRTQTEELLLAVDTRTGATRTLLTERDAAWLNLDAQMPRYLADGSFLWTSERGGAWQLEHRAADGSLRRALTLPELGYRGLAHVDEAANAVFVRAAMDPIEAHLWRVPLTGDAEPTQLTSEPGEHDAVFAASAPVWIDVADTVAGERFARVRFVDGRSGPTLTAAAEAPEALPRLEHVWTDTTPRMRAVIVRPRDFDPARRYPVVEWAYGGPHALQVRASPYRYLTAQWLADHGFIVVCVDGRGTPARGRDFERAIARDVISVPLADHALALRALGQRFPELDLTRVGVHGWSFGGYYAAMAALRADDLYKAAVAGAPVTDWHDYDTHYTERYMGLPDENAEGYASTSALTHAARLSRPLLLVHGTADDNVYFLHSLRLADALFRAGREFELLTLGGQTHLVSDPELTRGLQARLAGFFARHLGGPRAARDDAR